MKDQIFNFLKRHTDFSRPVLLALSGGPDSLCLLYLLMECKKHLPQLRIGIAHVDHQWRPESGREAEHLEALAHRLELPFHLRQLKPEDSKGNLEAVAREERLRFFGALCLSERYQAVLLAHQKNDQEETILKRVLEGTSICQSWGMEEIVDFSGLLLWRPLLNIPKAELERWLNERGCQPFVDGTNLDARFLRGRMRTEILPQLSSSFGKEIGSNLCYLGKESHEIHSFLAGHLHGYLSSICSSPSGLYLDLRKNCPQSALEAKFILRKMCEAKGSQLSRSSLEAAAAYLLQGASNKSFPASGHLLIVDRKCLFLTCCYPAALPGRKALIKDALQFGLWRVEMNKVSDLEKDPTDWDSIWNGVGEVILPEGDYELGPPVMSAAYPRTSSIAKWWNHHKVPAFLRASIPLIWKNNHIIHEFLTGKRPHLPHTMSHGIRIKILKISD